MSRTLTFPVAFLFKNGAIKSICVQVRFDYSSSLLFMFQYVRKHPISVDRLMQVLVLGLNQQQTST